MRHSVEYNISSSGEYSNMIGEYSASPYDQVFQKETKYGMNFLCWHNQDYLYSEKIFLYSKLLMLMWICSSTLQENVVFIYLNEYFSIEVSIYLTCKYLI